MSTISTIAIRHKSIKSVVNKLRDRYIVGQEVVKDFSNLFEFQLYSNEKDDLVVNDNYKGSRAFVIHQEHSPSWTQIDYELENIYEFDEILRSLTSELKTQAIIGYNQTTSGDFRFALFENGELKRSIFIQYSRVNDELRIMDNYGKKLPFETIDFGIPFTREMPSDQLLDYEVFNEWYKELGFIYEEREELEYLHLEIKNFKN